jgi:hypothetical protein
MTKKLNTIASSFLILTLLLFTFANDAHAGRTIRKPKSCPGSPSQIYFSHQSSPWGHHFVCIFHVFEDGTIQAGAAGHASAADLQFCQNLISNGQINLPPNQLVGVSPEDYQRFLDTYGPTTSNDPGISWCELAGACVVPFTIGYTKPCRMEARAVMSIIEKD